MELATQVNRIEDSLERLAAAQATLAEAQARTELRVEELAEAQVRTAEAQARTETQMEQLTASLARLADAQTQTEEQIRALRSWQAGEDGRRRGERLERQVLLRANLLLHGGEGGTAAEAETRRRLGSLLVPALGDELPSPEADPSLADIIWWKGDRMAVVEVSSVVDEHDVDRAAARAETLRRAGVAAVPIVIGDAWDHGETRIGAEVKRVEWKIGPDLSEGFIAFRRLPA